MQIGTTAAAGSIGGGTVSVASYATIETSGANADAVLAQSIGGGGGNGGFSIAGSFSAAGGGSVASPPFLVVPGSGQPPFDPARIPGQPEGPVFRR